jgi:hypothetical protein
MRLTAARVKPVAAELAILLVAILGAVYLIRLATRRARSASSHAASPSDRYLHGGL